VRQALQHGRLGLGKGLGRSDPHQIEPKLERTGLNLA